jgi:hypothetical protein
MSYKQELVLIPKKCRAPWCPRCGKAYWGKVRARVKPHFGLFKNARLLTLTIDPNNFESGQAAYEKIEGKDQYIKRFLRLNGFTKGFKVLAFHKPKASRPDAHNWPHWHIVVDLADVGGFADLRRMWRLWRDKWRLGGLDLQVKRKYRSAEAAINYAISYCQHQCDVVADWVADSTRSPRVYEFYGDLRKAVSEQGKLEKSLHDAAAANELKAIQETAFKSEPTYVGDRINHCGNGSAVLVKTSDNGHESFSYLCDLDYSPERIALFSKLYKVDVQTSVKSYGDTEVLTVSIPMGRHDTPENLITVLLMELDQCPCQEIPI